MVRVEPKDAKALQEAVRDAVADRLSLEIVGHGSKRAYGRPVEAETSLWLGRLEGVVDYEPAELVVSARSGTPLVEIERMLAGADQMLAFEPPDFSSLFGNGDRGTVGGMIACNLSGPRRIKAGAVRDHLLGFHGVTGHGTAFKSGGKVVKNVTGYDLSKLMCGSMGTLAALAEVSIKVLPKPETSWSILFRGLDDEVAGGLMARGMGSAHEVSGAAHLPSQAAASLGLDRQAITVLRLEGPQPSVKARFEGLISDLGAGEKLDGREALELWSGIRDVIPLQGDVGKAVWRLSAPPKVGAQIVQHIKNTMDINYFYDWAGGLIWLAVDAVGEAGAGTIRAALRRPDVQENGGGHATLVRAPAAIRGLVPVFEPQPAPLQALTQRIKTSFDPERVLNRGRMYEGV